MRRIIAITCVAVAALAMYAAGAYGSGSGRAAAATYPTLTVGISTGGPYTDNFNPFAPTSAFGPTSATSMIYEPLLQFDVVSATKIYPWLATSDTWSNNDKTLTFQLRHGVKWSDGKPFTSADVVYTFNLIKNNAALNTNGISFNTVSAKGAYTVVMTFATPSFTQLYNIGGNTYILPQHIWSKVSNPVTYLNTNPIGTGPFKLGRFATAEFDLVRNPNYWQTGKPEVGELRYPTFNGGTAAYSDMLSGGFDWAGIFEFHLASTYLPKNPKFGMYNPATELDWLVPNTTVWPLGMVDVRKAISLAINRNQNAIGAGGYAPGATSQTGLTLPNDASFLDPKYAKDKLTENAAQAEALLTSAGFSKDSNGFYAMGGKEITLSLEVPSAFQNWTTETEELVANLQAIGINASINAVATTNWFDDVYDGNFQMSIFYRPYEPNPYGAYDTMLDSTLAKPIGTTAAGDVGRYSNPAVQSLLAAYRDANSNAARTQAIYGLEGIMVNQVPVIPLVNAPNMGEYQTTRVTGFPSASNPYEPATPQSPWAEVIVDRLTPVK